MSDTEAEAVDEKVQEPPPVVKAKRWRTTCVAVSKCGRWIASGSDDCIVRIWEVFGKVSNVGVKSSPKVWELSRHTGSVRSLAFSFDSQMLCSGSEDHSLIIWDLKSGEAKLGPVEVSKVCFGGVSPRYNMLTTWSTTGGGSNRPATGHATTTPIKRRGSEC